MARFRKHMSNLVAAAGVNGTEAVVSIIRADEREGAACLEHLHSAKEDLLEVLSALDAAIAAEIGKNPTATPTIRRIQAVANPAAPQKGPLR